MNNTIVHSTGVKLLFFGWPDYVIFILMVGVSTLIGVYFGCFGKKANTPEEYVHGGREMSSVPISMSLFASLISSSALIGTPTEVYLHGILLWFTCIPVIIGGLISYYFFLPVLYELQHFSAYEYLEIRFNRSVRIMASFLSTIALLLSSPVTIYVSSLSFSTATGIHIYYIIPLTTILCIFYTILGGIKAVVWTDVLQATVMLLSSIVIVILGSEHTGMPGSVWERSSEGGRTNIDAWEISPLKRLSLLSILIGYPVYWVQVTTLNQVMMQRYISLPSYSGVRTSLILYTVGCIMIFTISNYTGLLIFATYYKCDPMKSEAISKPDQLLPYFVMDIGSSVPGLPGLFIAGVFSGGLSTLSSSLNAVGATVFEDFVRPFLRSNVSNTRINNTMKAIILSFGLACLIFAFVVDKLSNILQVVLSFGGVTSGTITGMFSFGMFFPIGNSKGVLVGSICSLVILGWTVGGNQKAVADGSLKYPVLPSSIEDCYINNNTLTDPVKNSSTGIEEEDVFALYRVSFMYYTWMAIIIVFVVGTVVSLLTERTDIEKMNPTLFTPLVRKYIIYKKRSTNKDKPVGEKLLKELT